MKQYPINEPGRTISANSFRWQHEFSAVKAAASKVGIIELEVVEKFAKYLNMIGQAQAFRDALRESLLKNGGSVQKSRPQLLIYIDALEVNRSAGHELLNTIQETYPN